MCQRIFKAEVKMISWSWLFIFCTCFSFSQLQDPIATPEVESQWDHKSVSLFENAPKIKTPGSSLPVVYPDHSNCIYYLFNEQTMYIQPTYKLFTKSFPREFSIILKVRYELSETTNLLSILDDKNRVYLSVHIGHRMFQLQIQFEDLKTYQFSHPDIGDGQWHYYALGVSKDYVTLFIDCIGVHSIQLQSRQSPNISTNGTLLIGGKLHVWDTKFQGSIQDIFIINGSLSASQDCSTNFECMSYEETLTVVSPPAVQHPDIGPPAPELPYLLIKFPWLPADFVQYMLDMFDPDFVEAFLKEMEEVYPEGLDLARPGPRGSPGTTGPRGPRGPPGPKGDKGQGGIKGEQGRVGFPGTPGSNGKDGSNGLDGRTGFSGRMGRKGQRGPKGEEGSKGEPGEEGPLGPPGWRGFRGPKGLKGFSGEYGMTGDKGFPGVRGKPGLQGEVGLMAREGEKGSQGPMGEKGMEGTVGDTGVSGAKGSQGENGAVGKPGEMGFKGEPGLAGPSGTQGEMGEPGGPGPAGESGVNGTKGSRGNPGEAGFPGYSGPTGAKGKPGMNGGVGLYGDTGEPGLLGFKGDEGQPGIKGLQGLPGFYGRYGKTGPSGLKGYEGGKKKKVPTATLR